MCPTFVSSGYNLGKKTQDAFLISAVVKLYLYNQKFKSWMDFNLFILYLHLQFINFTLIAPQHRVIYVGCTTFVWLNVLCIYKRLDVNSDVFKT